MSRSQVCHAFPRFAALLRFVMLSLAALTVPAGCANAAPPQFSPVVPVASLDFPRDFGAHPSFRNEWWYATGWLDTPDGKPLGFQVTFFRAATGNDTNNPSRFAARQLIIAHAALSDPAIGHLLHAQKIEREGFGLAYARTGNTDVRLDDWQFTRDAQGRYHASVTAGDFALDLVLTPSQPLLPEGEHGYSRKGPKAEQASYYYSEPQLQVSGTVSRNGKPLTVHGTAWLDHEWSTSVLDPSAAGWDWLGANLNDGSALMAFRIRTKDGGTLWSHALLRDKAGTVQQFGPDDIRFSPVRRWQSPRTNAVYPVAMRLDIGPLRWQLAPLQDDQELDSRQSTGSVYWEGAVTVLKDNQAVGRGYLELTGYVKPLKL